MDDENIKYILKTKKFKGFTLIELLAVIIILAIILVIAIPKIMDTIEKSRVSSMETSAKAIARAVENEYTAAQTKGRKRFSLTGSCMELADLDIEEFRACTYVLNNGVATISVEGEDDGEFEGYVCCDASKTAATCTNKVSHISECDTLLTDDEEEEETEQNSCFTYLYNEENKYAYVESYHLGEIESFDVDSVKCIDYLINEEEYASDEASTACESLKTETISVVEGSMVEVGKLIQYGVLKNVKYKDDGYSHCTTDVVIPETVTKNNNTYTVVAILENTFTIDNSYYQNLKSENNDISPSYLDEINNTNPKFMYSRNVSLGITSIELPDTIQYIGENALSQSALSEIDLPSSLLIIDDTAFDSNLLTSVTIPNSVVIIGSNAFSYNKISSLSLGSSLKFIGVGAFFKNKLNTVIIPNSVEEIDNMAFANNDITTLVLGSNLKDIGVQAFKNNENLSESGIIDNHVNSTLNVCYSTGSSSFLNTNYSEKLDNTVSNCVQDIEFSWSFFTLPAPDDYN